MKKLILIVCLTIATFTVFGQTQNQTSGWFMFLNSTKFNEKWGMHLDVQLRSADKLDHLRNVLIRPGLTYYINNKSNVTVGYLLNTTKTEVIGAADIDLTENRIWEQYILTHKISSIFTTHRFRLEQRFIEQNNGSEVFSQRFRYFFRLIQPLQKQAETFSKGAFLALQNELFFNVQHKDQLSGNFFDQNRAYLALGYRFSKKVDLEAGYLNQAINGTNNYTVNNVIQLALYTRF